MPAPEPIWRGSLALEEQVNSPSWEFSDRVSVTRTFKGPRAVCIGARPPNGAFGYGEYIGLRVVHCTLGPADKGGIWGLSFRMEGLPPGEPLPPDEGGTEMMQLEFALEKHPRYEVLSDVGHEKVQGYIRESNIEQRNKLFASLVTDEAKELAAKLLRGKTHYWMWVPVYKWTVSSYLPPVLDAGGYPQLPFGPFPFNAGYAWLRQGDTASYTGQLWKLTRSWLAADEWDGQIYPVL